MFEDSLLESAGKLRSKRQKYITLLSFCLQVVFAGVLILVPLIYTSALPMTQLAQSLQFPPAAPAPRMPQATAQVVSARTETVRMRIQMPSRIPMTIPNNTDLEVSMKGPSLMDVVGNRTANDSIGDPIFIGFEYPGSRSLPQFVTPPLQPPASTRISAGVAQGLLENEVTPIYPRPAILARIQGPVVLAATIGKEGSIQNLRVISGNPLLAGAALNAVKQWHYHPYQLNGEPVEVETQITVNFSLSGR